jgi:hypothetical protein
MMGILLKSTKIYEIIYVMSYITFPEPIWFDIVTFSQSLGLYEISLDILEDC